MKKVISLLLVLVLLAGLAGCSGGDQSSQSVSSSEEESSGSRDASFPTTSTSSASSASSAADGFFKDTDEKELVLFTWEAMFPREVLEDFEAQTGIQVTYANFDYDETMLTKLQTANGGSYDVIVADDYIIETVIQSGLAQKLDRDKLLNRGKVNPMYQGQFFDPADEYTIPYGAGVQTIVYDPAQTDVDIKGYADLWDPALKDNVGVIASYRVINGMALKTLGESYNTEDLELIGKAGDRLLELAPNIRLIKDDNIQDDLISGEIAAAVMYTSQVTMAKMASPGLKVVFPQEGIGFGIMGMFIPSHAPHAEAAHAFIDYILQPEVSAKCYEYLGYYCTNKEADSLISPEFQEFLTLPAEFSRDDMEMIRNVSAAATEEHEKVWNRFKSACN